MSPFVLASKMCSCHWENSTHLKNSVILSPPVFSHDLPLLGLCKLIIDLIICWKCSKHYEITDHGHYPWLWQIYHDGLESHTLQFKRHSHCDQWFKEETKYLVLCMYTLYLLSPSVYFNQNTVKIIIFQRILSWRKVSVVS
jgi:hypothetical protein